MITLNAVTGITSPNIDSPVGDNTPATGDFTTVNVSGALTAGTLNTGGGVLSPQTGFKNRIINGGMTIDQRNNGASVTPGNTEYLLDRWRYLASQSSKITAGRNQGAVTPPAGFTNYSGLTSSSAYSLLSGDFFIYQQFVEGFNAADLAWGTASAQPVTLSFWIRSSLTGTFGGALQNGDQNRSYPFAYTISAANTWEYKTISIAGDTTGTWLTNNGRGVILNFSIGTGTTNSGTAGAWAGSDFRSATGATSVVGTNGATFYITGVQLEKGLTATPFEFRSIGQELGLCQRYYQAIGGSLDGTIGAGLSTTTSRAFFYVKYLNTMRAVPTISGTSFNVTDSINYNAAVSGIALVTAGVDSTRIGFDTNAIMTQYRPALLQPTSSSAVLMLSAEL